MHDVALFHSEQSRHLQWSGGLLVFLSLCSLSGFFIDLIQALALRSPIPHGNDWISVLGDFVDRGAHSGRRRVRRHARHDEGMAIQAEQTPVFCSCWDVSSRSRATPRRSTICEPSNSPSPRERGPLASRPNPPPLNPRRRRPAPRSSKRRRSCSRRQPTPSKKGARLLRRFASTPSRWPGSPRTTYRSKPDRLHLRSRWMPIQPKCLDHHGRAGRRRTSPHRVPTRGAHRVCRRDVGRGGFRSGSPRRRDHGGFTPPSLTGVNFVQLSDEALDLDIINGTWRGLALGRPAKGRALGSTLRAGKIVALPPARALRAACRYLHLDSTRRRRGREHHRQGAGRLAEGPQARSQPRLLDGRRRRGLTGRILARLRAPAAVSVPEDVNKLLAELSPDQAAFIVASSASWGPTDDARRQDIAADFASVHVRGTKRTTRNRIVPVVLPMQQALLKFASEHGEGTSGYLFRRWTNAGRDIKAACKRAGVEPCTPNDLRRTFAVWLRSAGAPPDVIAPCMGHRDSNMVERVYGRLTPDMLKIRLRSAMGFEASVGHDSPVGNCALFVPDDSGNMGFMGRMGPKSGPARQPAKSRKPKRNRSDTTEDPLCGNMGPGGLEPPTLGLKSRERTAKPLMISIA